MSDLETLKAMLLRAGYVEKPGAAGASFNPINEDGDEESPDPDRLDATEFAVHRAPLLSSAEPEHVQSLEMGSGVTGYTGFACSFYFDADGNLIDHGVWE